MMNELPCRGVSSEVDFKIKQNGKTVLGEVYKGQTIEIMGNQRTF